MYWFPSWQNSSSLLKSQIMQALYLYGKVSELQKLRQPKEIKSNCPAIAIVPNWWNSPALRSYFYRLMETNFRKVNQVRLHWNSWGRKFFKLHMLFSGGYTVWGFFRQVSDVVSDVRYVRRYFHSERPNEIKKEHFFHNVMLCYVFFI